MRFRLPAVVGLRPRFREHGFRLFLFLSICMLKTAARSPIPTISVRVPGVIRDAAATPEAFRSGTVECSVRYPMTVAQGDNRP